MDLQRIVYSDSDKFDFNICGMHEIFGIFHFLIGSLIGLPKLNVMPSGVLLSTREIVKEKIDFSYIVTTGSIPKIHLGYYYYEMENRHKYYLYM